MKKLIIAFAFLILSSALFAQEKTKFQQAMGSTLGKMATAKTADEYQAIANTLARIADNEKEEWAPVYYNAFITTFRSFETENKVAAAALVAKADPLVLSTLELETVKADKNIQSEIHTLLAMMYNARMMENPMVLGAKFMPLSAQALGTAAGLNADNPRVWLLKGQNLFYTPEAFGGDKVKAKELLQKALLLFEKEEKQEAQNFMPRWGKGQAESILKQMGK